MDTPQQDISSSIPRVTATFRLGSETYSLHSDQGILSQQIAILKGESMSILKDFITRHNVPTDVPEPDEVSEDDSEIPEKPQAKKRK